MSGSTLSAQPRLLWSSSGRAPATVVTAAGLYILARSGNVILPATTNSDINTLILINQADLEVYERETLFRYNVRFAAANVAPNANVYASVHELANIAGTGASGNLVLGAEVTAARSATMALPGANAISDELRSPDFTLPNDGIFCIGLTFSAALASTSLAAIVLNFGVFAR